VVRPANPPVRLTEILIATARPGPLLPGVRFSP
jgi:hypothetical protein